VDTFIDWTTTNLHWCATSSTITCLFCRIMP
jgi:hypothetical protein